MFDHRKNSFYALLAILMMIIAAPEALPAKSSPGTSYAVHGTSYKTSARAASDVKAWQAKGYKATYAKVQIPGKGIWYRVYVGRYETREKATAAAEEMKRKQLIGYFSVEPLKSSAVRDKTQKETLHKPAAPVSDKQTLAKSVSATEKTKENRKKDRGAGLPSGKTEEKKPSPARVAEKSGSGGDTATAKAQAVATEKKDPAPAALPVEPPRSAVQTPVSTGNPLYDTAMTDFHAGQYAQAAVNLKKLHAQKLADPVMREAVVRRLADAHFSLGEKQGKQDFFNAVDYYKEILNDYPDPRGGNDLVYDRLSRSYDTLKFYYEASQALDKLIARYPSSPYHAEAMFRSAEVLNKSGKPEQAVEKYIAYLKKYPDGPRAKIASFITGDCYYRLGQSNNAETWYAQALKRWPDLTDLPKYIVIDLGYHNYRNRKFSEAVDVFSLYVSIYPSDEWSGSVMLALGRSLAEMNQTTMALKVFSQIIDRYPGSRESIEAAMAMANLGVEKPGLRVPPYLSGIDYYREPIFAYNLLLMKYPESDFVEPVLYKKANALFRIGRFRDANDAYGEFLRQFPQGKYRDDVIRNFRANTTNLVNDYYGKGDHVAVADLFYVTSAYGVMKGIDFETLFKIGDSLKRLGLYEEASAVFSVLTKMAAAAPNENRAILAMAEIDKLTGKDKDSEQKLLSLLNQPKMKDQNTLRTARSMMADIVYKRGLYDRAIESYRDVLGGGGDMDGILAAYEHYAGALKAKDMCMLAVKNYQKILEAVGKDEKKYPPGLIASAYTGMGDCYFADRKYKEGLAMYQQALPYIPEPERKMWSIYRMGQEYAKMQDYPQAEKSFAQLKAGGDGAFWTQVIEYWTESGKWSEKHAEYLKKP